MNDSERHYGFLQSSAAVLDLSQRGRLCVTGADRVRFLNGQVTNNVKDLRPGQGCYAALVNAKGKMQSDLNIYCLPDELLLDFEPGLSAAVSGRLEKYIIADDAQVVDVSSLYGMLTVQGPRSVEVVRALGFEPPAAPLNWMSNTAAASPTYCMHHSRGAAAGFDVFAPAADFATLHQQLLTAAEQAGGGAGTTEALEVVRIEAGIPKFGIDMDATNLASEAGIESRAISYAKGCYIGQEVISRIRAFGQVAKSLRGLRLSRDAAELPQRGEKLFHDGKEVGYLTSAVRSPAMQANIALGYVRRECNEPGTGLRVGSPDSGLHATVCTLPFGASRD